MKFCGYLLLLGLLAGCAARPEPRIYVLGTPTEPTPGMRDDLARRVIEIRSVRIPDHLDTTDILLRTGTNGLLASDSGIWGERLSVGITQALTAALARRVPTALVVVHPPARPQIQILVDITALECRASGDCALTAHWSILQSRGDPGASQTLAAAQGSFVTHADGPGDSGVVAAISAAIGQLADQIAARL